MQIETKNLVGNDQPLQEQEMKNYNIDRNHFTVIQASSRAKEVVDLVITRKLYCEITE